MTDSTCNNPANDVIEAVAFGFASESERQLLQEHIVDCAICSQALEQALLASEVLPLSVVEMDVPESVWDGIEQRVGIGSPPTGTALASPIHQVERSPFPLYWAAAAMLALFTLAAGILLGRTVFEAGPDRIEPQAVAVSITDPEIDATGTVQYLADQGVILLNLDNLPLAPDGFVYQLWWIEDDTPISAGLLPTSNSFAAAVDPAQFDLLCLTLEQGPTGSDQPTSDPLIIADLEPLRGS